jgi:hypothetical protein
MTNLGGELPVSGTVNWLTPPDLLARLGTFDLDPCSPIDRPWDTAKKHYTILDDGLSQPWHGRVWLNPPYGPGMEKWLDRLANHDGGGLALIFARTETRTFFDHVWARADGILFIKGRIRFCRPDGRQALSAGSPSVLVAYGKAERDLLATHPVEGKYLDIN